MSVAVAEVATDQGRASRPELPPSMVERMTLILDAFPQRTSRLTLEEVARATHLPRSTAHRILDQLVRLQWLDHTSFGYSLGRRARQLGGGDDAGELRSAASPFLHSLMLRTGLTVHLAVLDGGEVRYLDKLGGRFATSVPSRVGGHAAAHTTALGKAMLAWLDPEDIEERVGAAMAARRTGGTSIDLNALHQEMHRIRSRRGLAFEQGECFEHIGCVAAAVQAPEGPIAAISLVGDSSTQLDRVGPLVLDAARQVSLALFPNLDSLRPRRTRERASVPGAI